VIVGAGAAPVRIAVDDGFLVAVSLVGCAWEYLGNKGTFCERVQLGISILTAVAMSTM
jgi:hypothetical protein